MSYEYDDILFIHPFIHFHKILESFQYIVVEAMTNHHYLFVVALLATRYMGVVWQIFSLVVVDTALPPSCT